MSHRIREFHCIFIINLQCIYNLNICLYSFAIKEIKIKNNCTTFNLHESTQVTEISVLFKLKGLTSIGYEHIIKYYDFFFIDNNDKFFYLVLELCDVCIYFFKYYYVIFINSESFILSRNNVSFSYRTNCVRSVTDL